MNHAVQQQLPEDQSARHAPSPSTTSVLRTPQPLASRYQFIEQIGHGSQAKVYLAKRLSDQTNVTIKQLNIESVSNWKAYDLFHRESAVLANLRIDGIARFYESIECLDDTPACSYIVQEYIRGQSIAAMLKTGKRFTANEVYDILIQLLNILYQLQNRNIPVIHRDIKPSNIMLTPRNNGYHVTLIDFGAVSNPQVQSGGSTIAGTYGYMPPEQLMGKPQPASDIYAVAAVAVELFSGKSPADLPHQDFRLIFEPELENQPIALVNTLRRMLEPDANLRFCNIPELCDTFQNYKKGIFSNIARKQHEDNDFNQKLTEVTTLCEPGNTKLWQSLPDTGPRELPDSYRLDVNLQKKAPLRGKLGHLLLILFLPCLLILFLSVTSVVKIPLLANILVFLPPILWFIWIFYISSTLAPANNKARLLNPYLGKDYYYNPRDNDISPKKLEVSQQVVNDLIKNGRKTMATITSITYRPQKSSITVKNLIIAPRLPCFEVQYRFNPPDDMREEDLIHKCIIHTDNKDHFNPGDPLPILYLINKTDAATETVASMPFPFPLEDATQDEIIDISVTVAIQPAIMPAIQHKGPQNVERTHT